MNSWCHLHECNREQIGDNPDLLKVGTRLKIPQWDLSRGDAFIRARGGDVGYYTGRLRYAYPWVVYSVTMSNNDGSIYREETAEALPSTAFSRSKQYEVRDGATGTILASGSIDDAQELMTLVPDVERKQLLIDSVEYDLWTGEAR